MEQTCTKIQKGHSAFDAQEGLLRYILMFGMPIFTFATGVPLLMRWISPNRWYGFRTAATLASDSAWFSANEAVGLAMVMAGVVSLVLSVCIEVLLPTTDPTQRLVLAVMVSVMLLLGALFISTFRSTLH